MSETSGSTASGILGLSGCRHSMKNLNVDPFPGSDSAQMAPEDAIPLSARVSRKVIEHVGSPPIKVVSRLQMNRPWRTSMSDQRTGEVDKVNLALTKPEPPALIEKTGSICVNRWNSRPNAEDSIPGPVSVTLMLRKSCR